MAQLPHQQFPIAREFPQTMLEAKGFGASVRAVGEPKGRGTPKRLLPLFNTQELTHSLTRIVRGEVVW